MKKILFIFFTLSFWLIFNKSILASQNIFGLHLTQTSDIDSAKDIINSNGGDWGWTTIVVSLNNLDQKTWQDFFDKCRKYHLIPIMRLATYGEGDSWKRPTTSDIDNLSNFLNSLNWPTKQQYVILFNEPNHAQEWGGEVDVKSFIDMSIYTSKKLKELNPNFYILSGALDLAAPDTGDEHKSAKTFYQEIWSYNPDYFSHLDGIASHSYPNHGFIGTPKDTGQHSIQGYKWEIEFLKKLGVSKNIPIFITETGWPHKEGINKRNNFYTTTTTAKFLLDSYNLWSKDPQIKAITPFIYNYPNEPFDHFSWLDSNEKLYPSYQGLIDYPKIKNTPEQLTKYEFYKNQIPFLILGNTEYNGQISLKNTGQSIWGETHFCIQPIIDNDLIEITPLCTTQGETIYPNQIKIFSFKFKIKKSGNQKISLSWENIPKIEISSFSDEATIYHPKFNLIDKIKSFFTKFW